MSDAKILPKAASILRKQLLKQNNEFVGNFSENCQKESVPPSLLAFVSLIQHGGDIQSQTEHGASQADLAMAQVLQFNCQKPHNKISDFSKHSQSRETPFPIYVGVLIYYAKTRKRLHQHIVSLSYDRVLQISQQLGEAVVNRVAEGLVCPSVQ